MLARPHIAAVQENIGVGAQGLADGIQAGGIRGESVLGQQIPAQAQFPRGAMGKEIERVDVMVVGKVFGKLLDTMIAAGDHHDLHVGREVFDDRPIIRQGGVDDGDAGVRVGGLDGACDGVHGLFLGRFGGDDMGPAAGRVGPERKLGIFLEQIGGDKRAAGLVFHLGPDPVQSRDAQWQVELRRVVVHVVEIVLESGLADELVDQRQHLARGLGQELVIQHQQRTRLFPVKRLAQGRPGIAD